LQGRKLSFPSSGTTESDLLNLPDNWMKNITGERLLFGYFFLAVEEKVTGSKGFGSKLTRMSVLVRA
jgi:hypothetical protein